MSTITKKSSKRKAESDSEQQPLAAAAAEPVVTKTEVKAKKKPKVIIEEKEEVLELDTSNPPAHEQVEEEEEMKDSDPPAAAAAASSSTALVPVVAASSALVTQKFTRLNPHIERLEDDEDAEEPVPLLDKMRAAFIKNLPLVKRGACKVTNPDLALALWSAASNMRVSWVDLDMNLNLVQVRRTVDKVDSTVAYINAKLKGDQSFIDDVRVMGLSILSPFSEPAFLRHGYTVETGVNGTLGKVIRNNATPAKEAQYQVTLQNKPITNFLVDANFNNPIFDYFIDVWQRVADKAMMEAMKDSKNMVEMRNKVALSHKKNKQPAKMPENEAEWVEYMKCNNFFKTLRREDESDETARGLGVSVSCYRGLRKKYEGKAVVETEDLTDYTPPSDMFKEQEFHKSGRPQVHNNIPVYRCRRADEIEPGKTYSSPFILIPKENAVLTSGDRIAVLMTIGLYEWLYDTPGVTNKQLAYIWLGKADDLKKVNEFEIEAVDPRFGIPMAQKYIGPLDRASAGPAGVADASGNGVSFAPVAPNDPDHAGFATA